MAPPIQYVRTADGASIAFQLLGEGPPILIIPGPGISIDVAPHNQIWMQDLEPRYPADFQIIRYDRRGCGKSTRDADVTAELLVKDCLSIIDFLGFASVHVHAAFAGTLEGLRLALDFPERVRGLVLHLPEVPGAPETFGIGNWRHALQGDWDHFITIFARAWGDPAPGEPVLPGLIEQLRSANSRDAFRAFVAQFCEVDDSGRLSAVTVPTLVMQLETWPEYDRNAELYASQIPGAKLIASHRPDFWNLDSEAKAALRAFLFDSLPQGERRSEAFSPGEATYGSHVALSDRETEVLRLVSAGKSNRQIAAELTISLPTVAAHLRHILDKLGVENRAAAAAWAVRAGLA